jgi:hypothetical protein
MALSPNGARVSAEKQRLLDLRLWDGMNPSQPHLDFIPRRPSDRLSPLMPSQEQVWLRSQRAISAPALYNEVITIHRSGPMDIPVFERSFSEVIARHEAWRTVFDLAEEHPVQVVQPPPEAVRIPFNDLTQFPLEFRAHEALNLLSEQVRMPFDLRNGPLWSTALVKTGHERFRFSIVAHQAIVDGISAYQILPAELALLYAAYSEGRPSPLPALTVQYADFSAWQNHRLQSGLFEKQFQYWLRQLAPPLPVPRWPNRQAKASLESFQTVVLPFTVPLELSQSLVEFARKEGTTLFMILLSGFASLLHIYTDQPDLIIATLSPCGRKHSEAQRLLGYFLNPVALRFDLSGNLDFGEILALTRVILADALSNDDVPIELLSQRLCLETNCDSFVKVAVSLQPRNAPCGTGWVVTTMDAPETSAVWDFYLAFMERETGLIGRVQYNPSLIDESEVNTALGDLWSLLEAAVSNPRQKVRDIWPQ